MPPRPFTAVPGSTKFQQFTALWAERNYTHIGAEEWQHLRSLFAESSLREWLRDAGISVEQPYRGIQTKTFEELEASLLAMGELYQRDTGSRKVCRGIVITAKDRTRFAARNPKVDPAKQAAKAEMVQWMLIWLDDPAMFPAWAALRKRVGERQG